MPTKILFALTLLAALILPAAGRSQSMNTILGKITKIDPESGVVSIESGSIDKQTLIDNRLNADLIWDGLRDNGYIDDNGTLQIPFYALDKFNKMQLPRRIASRKRAVFDLIHHILDQQGPQTFNIQMNSDLLRGTHTIASLEIEEGDPVKIEYDPANNNIIRMIDNKSADEDASQ